MRYLSSGKTSSKTIADPMWPLGFLLQVVRSNWKPVAKHGGPTELTMDPDYSYGTIPDK